MLILFCFFFFSSRRRHTRCSRDWSSDVCSSDLDGAWFSSLPKRGRTLPSLTSRSEERREGKSVDLGGRRIIKKKKKKKERRKGNTKIKRISNNRTKNYEKHW